MQMSSLASRLTVALIAAQVGAIFVAMILLPMMAPFVSFDEIGDIGFRSRILGSLERDAINKLQVSPSPDLLAYMADRPGARFAIFALSENRVIPGSDQGLAERLQHLSPYFPTIGGNLVTEPTDFAGKLVVTRERASVGEVVTMTTGNQFGFVDLPNLITIFLPVILPIYGPVLIGALALIPLVVRFVTRPIVRLAAEAGEISPDRLEARLGESGLGSELQTLARAINAAMSRVEAGVDRQRRYAANAAHELRTPLSILGLHLDALPASPTKNILQADLARVSGLMEQLVTVARLGQNHVSMDEQIDLVDLAADVVADRAPIALKYHRDIAFCRTIDQFHVRGNRQALFSALGNVVDNAIRAEPEGGTIQVSVNPHGIVDVVDHGEGIRESDVETIFEPFWRGTGQGTGAGLGLAIVREIVVRHRATVYVAQSSPTGTTLRFNFGEASR